jgi:hypothetical protein
MALVPKRSLLIGGALAGVLVLYVLGTQNRPEEGGGEPAANSTQCRVTVTADALNVRAAPAADAQRVGRYTRGTQVDADRVVENGFRKIGENRWVATEFIQPLPGRDCG